MLHYISSLLAPIQGYTTPLISHRALPCAIAQALSGLNHMAKNCVSHVFILLTVFLCCFNPDSFASEEPLALQLRETFQQEVFTINALVQAGMLFSIKDIEFRDGHTFAAPNARLSFRGLVDNQFYYRIFFNLAREPHLLDAYVGYQHSDALRFTLGAMKPRQTQDYIPDPGSTDFIERSKITGKLVQSRELGISADGDINGFYYYAGLYNGNKLELNNNNKFYGIGRLQYTITDLSENEFQLAVQGSHGDSPDVRSGRTGPVLRGERTIYGGDIRMETNRFLLAAEYLEGSLETELVTDQKETINGYYITGGFRISVNTMILSRWQTWNYNDQAIRDNQLTFGLNHSFTSIASMMVNFDSYISDSGSAQSGVSLIVQVQF